MGVFRVERETPAGVAEAWRRVTDWRAHARLVPLTRVTAATAGETRAGSRFTARTGVGRFGFDDPMEVVRWEPPVAGRAAGRCRLEKRGRVVTGWAEIAVRETAAGGTRVTWTEEVRLRGLPRACDALLARAGRLVFGRALAGLLRERTGSGGASL
ncbi:SRPBCC family protein [Streptomyces sp. NRRL S-118]|uniref:SRPBCC family protein n=1 Tax=Streptomyces sp. NRRL S-118 TaxID=1463881 RepID=UPI0004C7E5EA|nr:SRPBCC family protein [Streptomyces sp. NRRL S-118]